MSKHLKKKIIWASAPFMTALGVDQVFRNRYAGIGHILMFHRVVPTQKKKRIHNHDSLEITPEHLERIIGYYKKNNYRFCSLDELHQLLMERQTPAEKLVVFTFDDGYKDNFHVAYPILKKHQVPFTIYVTTGFLEKKAVLWWYILEDLLKEEKQIRFHWKGIDYIFNCRTSYEKELAFTKIRGLINQSFVLGDAAEMFEVIFGDFQHKMHTLADSMMMTWDEVRTISKDKLVTIGAHTINHFPLAQLDIQALQREISDSKTQLENSIDLAVDHFAYPFGKITEASFREFELIKSLGFKTGTTTRMGNIFSEHANHLECLPRISINRFSTTKILQLQTSGMLQYIQHKGKKIITY